MLGIAQICGGFTITSRPKEGKGFRAKVRLYDLLREKLDADDETIVGTEEVNVGEYDWEEFDETDMEYGTVLIADDVHPTFIRSFQQSLKFEQFREPPLNWEKALKIVSTVRSLQELGDYWRLLWELAASCPVPYVDETALPNQLIVDIQKKLLSFNFKVIVDGINLKKPVYLEGNPGGYTTFNVKKQNITIYGKPVSFSGYLLVQEGSQLKPDELRGIMVRVRNVGIGYYDPTMLDYRYNEGPRSRWLTGEIFVDHGLENALNIDRDSFNRFHPEFRAVQEFVHEILHKEIFPVSYKKIEERSTIKKDAKSVSRQAHLEGVISKQFDAPVMISKISPDRRKRDPSTVSVTPTVKLSHDENRVELALPTQDVIKTKKIHRQLALSILAIFEIVLQEKEPEKQRETFTAMLLELLEGW